MHAVEEETARSARRVVATYAQDFLDGVTLMSMLGVEPEGLVHRKVLAEQVDAEPKTTRKKATKKTPAKKATKKTAAKKATKKTAAKKATKKTTAKKTSN
jgi:cobalamin-dependent methionine synthase I